MTLRLSSKSCQPITGAILAGGLSTRMGQDKAALRLHNGRTMLEHVAQAMKGACETVLMVGTNSAGHARGFVWVKDLRPQCGPLGGIEALLASGIDPLGQYLVCPCDVPMIATSILKMLIVPCKKPATVFRIQSKPPDKVEPLPARISANALPIVRCLLDTGHRSVWKLMEELQPHVVDITAEQARSLLNVNTIEDLRLLDID